ncbi:CgeB family protein [Butyrivibrio sp. YAB3001]|uniref:CgeB family protein n=1 Tax=Butyrivibrio sp. YAB3001 TaxID=1520812 RepID=UPI0008F62F3E|nr:glycosyltransferase [Butyrivibrio sp. YAB3001]SFB95008.1 Spore maturation protein CgeB [Butyrivibrio sp. YAB3001]
MITKTDIRILVVNPYSYINEDIVVALKSMYGDDHIEEIKHVFKDAGIYEDEDFAKSLKKKIEDMRCDVVISTNFFPIVATACNECAVPYIAWTYDTPMNVVPCEQMRYETNYIFLFDRMEMEKYRQMGYNRFWYMPLGVNTKKYERFKASQKYCHDIAFMGKMYKSKLPMIRHGLSEGMLQYLDKLADTQYKIFGKYIIEDMITDPIIDEINREHAAIGYDLIISKQQLAYAMSEYVTYLDRMGLLEMMGRRFQTHLYTYDIDDNDKAFLKDVKIHGPVNYDTEMPILFKSAKISLSGSMRAARSAIPLRALDILGCGGFLLSSVQPELEEYFKDREEVVLFRSIEEAIDLAGYYLSHEDERIKIAQAGLNRVKKDFKYTDRLNKMIEQVLR